MAVKIRLKRMGKIRKPFYRVVVADSRTKRDGRAIEEIGIYHPTEEPSRIEISSERAQYWLGVGAQPTDQVLALLKVTGDWQKFKGLPGAEGTLRTAEPKPDKKALYDAALAEAYAEPKGDAITKKQAKADTKTDKADDAKPAGDKPAVKADDAKAADKAESDKPAASTDGAKADDKPAAATATDES